LLKSSFVASISCVSEEQWAALQTAGNPFVAYRFLQVLEQSESVGGDSGWQPYYLLLHNAGQQLIGAAPCYIKHHSYGEYVFDWGWANAYQRAGLAYYPKMVCCVPFTPVTGNRLLTAEGTPAQQQEIRSALASAMIAEAQRLELSSVHCLFMQDQDHNTTLQANSGWLARHDLQFHWRNQGYEEFSDFLRSFSSKKRKNVNRERRRVSDAGIEMEVLTGSSLTREHWQLFYQLYRLTAYKRGGTAYLTEEFFRLVAQNMAESVVMVMARHGDRYVAAALNFRGDDTLYGRYWGCLAEYDSLHFETCYYRAIEFCIEQRIHRYEAGAQGEHKLSRGFLPTQTRSAHWLAHPQFADAVADYLEDERQQIAGYQELLQAHTPFRQGGDG